MPSARPLRIGYVVKRYPRFSETFIVEEILAHERAGLPLHIFAVRRVNETHFQSTLSHVRSAVTYIPDSTPKAETLWATIGDGHARLPDFPHTLAGVRDEEAGDVYQAILLALQVLEHEIDHLHAHFATVATSVARLAAHFAGISYSFTAHAKDIFHADVQPEAFRAKLHDAAAVITVSDYNVEWLSERYGTAALGVRRVYNGVDLDAFPYSPSEARPRVILAVGRLVEKKGFGALIDACALLQSRGVLFRCTIIGDGPLRDDLASRIDGHALGDQVALIGPRPRVEVVEAIRGAAVFAAPCVIADDGDRDGLPTVLLEAMALGTPCVSTDVTGIPEIVRDGSTGLCVPQNDPAALAAALERLLDDGALRVRLSQAARHMMERDFDVAGNAAALRAMFAQSIESRAVELCAA